MGGADAKWRCERAAVAVCHSDYTVKGEWPMPFWVKVLPNPAQIAETCFFGFKSLTHARLQGTSKRYQTGATQQMNTS